MAYSMGFSPHPKVSWVGASPTGVASEAEYVEIQLVDVVDPARLGAALDAALPQGLDVLEVVVAGPGALPDRIEASRWRIELPGIGVDELRAATAALLREDRIEVERLTKNGRRTIDARAAVVSAEVVADEAVTQLTPEPDSEADSPVGVAAVGGRGTHETDDWRGPATPYGILETVVRQTSPAVRPDDVLSALRVVAGLVPPVPPKAIRMAQGKLDDAGRLVDPLAADQGASRTA